MKKVYYSFIFALFCLLANAQSIDYNDFVKPADYATIQDAILKQMRSKLKSGVVSEVRYFNVKFHVVTKIDGSAGLDISLLPKVLNMLNTAFLPAKIQFVSCQDINYIRNDTIFVLPPGISKKYWAREAREDSLWEKFDVNDAINVFFFRDNSHRGISWKHIISIQNGNALIALPHEMGHSFGLLHTFSSDENFSRDTSDYRCNCDSVADRFCDTPADPDDLYTTGWCDYTGSVRDKYGFLLKPDTKNIMSYYFCEDKTNDGQLGVPGTLLSHFSNEQSQFMSNYANNKYTARKVTPVANKTYATNAAINSSGSTVLKSVLVTNNAKLSVSACEIIIEDNVEIGANATLEILK